MISLKYFVEVFDVDGFRFEAIGVALTGFSALVGLGSEGLGTLTKHGFVKENTKTAEQAFEAGFVELLQDGIQEFRVVLVGHEGFACWCFGRPQQADPRDPPQARQTGRSSPFQVRLRSVRYAHLHSAAPGRGWRS